MAEVTALTQQNFLRILIVEDNQGERELLRDYLNNCDIPSFTSKIWDAPDLVTALNLLDSQSIDVVILDLNLPDCVSLETFLRLRDRHPEVAVVVMTGQEDEALGVEAIRHQAQDYLPKGKLDEFILGRTVRYALERQRLRNELELLRLQQRQRQEMYQLEHYSNSNPEKDGRIFSLSSSYGALVRQYVFAAREGNIRPSSMVQALAQRLVFMRASARDVVRLHLKVLKETGNWTTAAEERAFGVDARLALVELLGTLADLYRDLSNNKREAP
ncbi:putative Response regulator [Gammaproteobacteria bacterium]